SESSVVHRCRYAVIGQQILPELLHPARLLILPGRDAEIAAEKPLRVKGTQSYRSAKMIQLHCVIEVPFDIVARLRQHVCLRMRLPRSAALARSVSGTFGEFARSKEF